MLIKSSRFRPFESLILLSFQMIASYRGDFIYESKHRLLFKQTRQPPTFPRRLQRSIIGRLGLNHRVRDVYGCDP